MSPLRYTIGKEEEKKLALKYQNWRYIVYDIAENRLHVQKAIMALTMAKGWK